MHDAARVDDRLEQLIGEQCGVLSVAQGRQYDLSRKAIAYRVTSGRWQRVHPGVYATRTGKLDFEQRVWAGYLYAGEGAVVSRRSAWWWADRELDEPGIVQIDVPHRRMVKSQAGLNIVRTRRLDEADIHPIAWPRRFRVERAVLDCAAAALSLESAAATVAKAVQRRTTSVGRLLEVLDRLSTLPRRRYLHDVLVLAGEGAHTLIEQAQAQCCRSHGLPEPDRQRQIGATLADAAYDMPLGTVLAEFDGKLGHLEASSWWKDMQRDNRNMTAGLATLRFPGFILLSQPHLVAVTIAEALTVRGWTGTVSCPRGCPGV